MKKSPPRKKISAGPGALRRRAELRLAARRKPAAKRTVADHRRQLHELEVHQIELEMQNEELAAGRVKLETLLEKYTDLYDFAPVGYLTLDRAGVICEANLTGADLLGATRSALLKQHFRLAVLPAERPVFDAFLQQVFASGGREECDVSLQAAGRPAMEVRIRANASESGAACRLALSDITGQKRAEADRLIVNKLESMGILAGGIAHDFNNLLTVILLNLELAELREPLGKELRDHLEMARTTALMARNLTAQFITFAGGGAPVRQRMFLSEMIREAARPALSGSNMQCEFSLAENLWRAEVDAEHMSHVIRNIVCNACDAMPGGGRISVRAENVVLQAHEQPALPAGEYVRVSIADAGQGIAKDVLPKIFDPYFSTKRRGEKKGMGLGLTICHAVMLKHQGAIVVDSAAGAGAVFHLYLPAARKRSGGAKAAP